MLHVTSSTSRGIDALPVTVETDLSFGMRAFTIVGLPDLTVRESRDRIRAALKNSGYAFPRGRVTVNLAPANIKKQGPVYDLPIAISILVAAGEIMRTTLKDALVLGELALDGVVRPVEGILNAALMAKREGKQILFVPKENAQEALCIDDVTVLAVDHLKSIVDHLKEIKHIEPAVKNTKIQEEVFSLKLEDIRGQELAKRGLEIAAAGGHNILLKGPPGTGKTLLARGLPSILPPLSTAEAIEVTSIASISGQLPSNQGLIYSRPFRSPHHSASAVSLVGGGTWPRPGEISLSHRGVLFLDELPEFSRHVLEHLRQPLEDGYVTISRATGSVIFPARFLLAAAMNPCPCGYLSDPKHLCTCTHGQIQRYQKKISGPLLDRFDLLIEVANIDVKDLNDNSQTECSTQIRERVTAARERQLTRFNDLPFFTNNEMPPGNITQLSNMSVESVKLLQEAFSKQRLSARGYFRTQKVARTIADLDNSDLILPHHIAEALQFRGTGLPNN